MASDEKRREVAERMRELPSDTYAALKEWEDDGLFIDASLRDEADYSQIHNAILGCFPAEHMHPGDYEELHNRLADLIDRPTCHDTEELVDSFTCSSCGFSERNIVFNPFTYSFRTIKQGWKYCPNCGARVVGREQYAAMAWNIRKAVEDGEA